MGYIKGCSSSGTYKEHMGIMSMMDIRAFRRICGVKEGQVGMNITKSFGYRKHEQQHIIYISRPLFPFKSYSFAHNYFPILSLNPLDCVHVRDLIEDKITHL